MSVFELTNLKRVLCIGCHADDIEIGLGATLLRLIEEYPGLAVHWVVLSAASSRAEEARASAAGFLEDAAESEVEIAGFRDSYFPAQYSEIKDHFHSTAERVEPDLVFTHRVDDAHQDHRVAAELTWCVWRNHPILSYEIPKYEGDLGRPNVYVPTSESAGRRKVQLLMDKFPSQRGKGWFQPKTFESLMRLRGIECNATSGWAEAFYATKLVL